MSSMWLYQKLPRRVGVIADVLAPIADVVSYSSNCRKRALKRHWSNCTAGSGSNGKCSAVCDVLMRVLQSDSDNGVTDFLGWAKTE